MDWVTLLATVAGGGAALLGTVIAHALRSRDERRRASSTQRRDAYVDYLVALDGAFSRLRALADPDSTPQQLTAATSAAFGDAGVYRARERLLLVGHPAVVSPAEAALHRLADFRDAVRDGAKRRTVAYHDAYHPYAEALWRLRLSIRQDLGSVLLTPADLEKETWESQVNCEFCRRRTAPPVPAQPTA